MTGWIHQLGMHHRFALMSSLVGAVVLGGLAQAAVAAEAEAAPVKTQTKINAAAPAPAAKADLGATKINASAKAPGVAIDPKVSKALLKVKPLSKAQWLDKGKILGIIQGSEGVQGTVAVSPRHPWLDANTVMKANFAMMVRPEDGTDGLMTIDRHNGTNPGLVLNFRARANSDYLVDCAISGSGSFRYSLYSPATYNQGNAGLSAGHLTMAIAEHSAKRDMEITISNPSEFTVGRCEITEVR